jgi:hypothetical protein
LRDLDTFVDYDHLNVTNPVVPVNAVIPGSITLLTTVLAFITQARNLFPGATDPANERRDNAAAIGLIIIIFFGYLHLVQTQGNTLNTSFNRLSDKLQNNSRDVTCFVQDSRSLGTTKAQIKNKLFLHQCRLAFREEGRDFDVKLAALTQTSQKYPQLPKNKGSQNPYCNR